MPKAAPILTIGVPVYNEGQFLAEALESLVGQTRRDWVMCISDNASTDDTEDICRSFAKRDPRIHYVRHEENRGAAFNWKYVLDQADTPLFAWVGGHDTWAPTFLEALTPCLQAPEVIMAYPQTRAVTLSGDPGQIYSDDHSNESIAAPGERLLRVVRHLGICNMLHGIWRTEVLRSVPIRLSFSSDSLLIAELSLLGCYVQHPEVLFFRRQVRATENSRERVARAWAEITNSDAKGTPGWLAAMYAYIQEYRDIIHRSKAPLSHYERTRLAWQVALIIARRYVVGPAVREMLLPSLPAPLVQPLRKVWRRRPSARRHAPFVRPEQS